ncbi:MAG: MetS family NSS transporter small subunit [Desulfotomaculum sp.]|nr:MetS family NSS transporter small subunit [Desulfotomaculum sp.]
MTGSAIAMMILAIIMLWGGAAYCINIAMKNRHN